MSREGLDGKYTTAVKDLERMMSKVNGGKCHGLLIVVHPHASSKTVWLYEKGEQKYLRIALVMNPTTLASEKPKMGYFKSTDEQSVEAMLRSK